MIPIEEAIDRIGKALERRSGRPWSVTAMEGEGLPEWLRVTTTPDRFCTDWNKDCGMAAIDRTELTRLFNLLSPVGFSGLLIPGERRAEFAARAETGLPDLTDPDACCVIRGPATK